MHMGVSGVEMAVDESGLVGKVDLWHEFRGDPVHHLVRELIVGMEVQGKMHYFGLAAFVEDHLLLQPVEFVIEGQLGIFLPVIKGTEKPGLALLKLLFVVQERLAGVS
jgi:hypothetical protein